MIYRRRERGPDGSDIIHDIDAGPGPVGAMKSGRVGGMPAWYGDKPNLGGTLVVHQSKALSGSVQLGKRR